MEPIQVLHLSVQAHLLPHELNDGLPGCYRHAPDRAVVLLAVEHNHRARPAPVSTAETYMGKG
jgi:hypothetical protein